MVGVQEAQGSRTTGLIFDQGHLVGFNNCKALIRVHYLNLDLCHLSASSMDISKFIIELAANPSPPREKMSNASYRGAPLQSRDSLGGSRVAKDPSPITRGPTGLKNNEGQSSKAGSWNDDDQPPSKVGTIDPKARKSKALFQSL